MTNTNAHKHTDSVFKILFRKKIYKAQKKAHVILDSNIIFFQNKC